MNKKGFFIGVVVVLGAMFFVRYLLSNTSLNDISIAGSVTACISFWGLTIAHRKMKHWELEQCQELGKTLKNYRDIKNETVEKWNNDLSAFSSEYTDISANILNFWEDIALNEQKSYLDRDLLYNIFTLALIEDLEKGLYDKYQEQHEKNKTAYCHMRKLYIKWKKRLKKEQHKKHLSKDWDTVQGLITEARESNPELAKRAHTTIAYIEKAISNFEVPLFIGGLHKKTMSFSMFSRCFLKNPLAL